MSTSLNTARYMLFTNVSKSETMTPTNKAFRLHLMCAYYRTMIWRNACVATPELPAFTEKGETK